MVVWLTQVPRDRATPRIGVEPIVSILLNLRLLELQHLKATEIKIM